MVRVAAVVALLLLGACGPRSGTGVLPPRGPVILRMEPGCIYRTVGHVRQRIDATIPPEVGIRNQARALSADAVIEGIPEFERNDRGQITARIWTGTAVVFSDPSDPNCYR